MKRPYRHYKTHREHAEALSAGWGGGKPYEAVRTPDDWLALVAHAINVGRNLAAAQWRRRLKEAEQRVQNLAERVARGV